MKRFIDTAWFDQEWFIALVPEMKSAWLYVWSKCDAAGVWMPSKKLAEFQVGKKVDWDKLREACGARLMVMPNGSWFLPDFVPFQCGKLSEACRPHVAVISMLRSHGLMPEDSLSIVFPKTTDTAQEQYKERDKEQEQPEGVQGEPRPDRMSGFTEFWTAYPKKAGKGDAEKAWEKHHCFTMTPKILTSIRALKITHDWTKEGGQFVPHPATWLNRKGWDDEPSAYVNGTLDKSRTCGLRKGEGVPVFDPMTGETTYLEP